MPVSPEEFDRSLRELEALADAYSERGTPQEYGHYDDLGDYHSIEDVFQGYLDYDFNLGDLSDWLDEHGYDTDAFWDDFRDYYGSN